MNVIHIQKTNLPADSFPFFAAGFRPFFFGAALFTIVSMAWWMGIYVYNFPFTTGPFPPQTWHAHEMIYGYSSAVIAGFLLTAITNWTGIQTVQGKQLAFLCLLWLAARVLLLFGMTYWIIAAVCDLLFLFFLCISIMAPLIAARQWKQIGIATKILLLLFGNCLFYFGIMEHSARAAELSVYGGLYLVISLILTIAGRVFPGFIQNAVTANVRLSNPRWIAIATLAIFLIFFINQLFLHHQITLLLTAGALSILTISRLVLWHTSEIWRHPLLWSLYMTIASIAMGFVLFAFSALGWVSPFLAIHAFASGGIGFATLGMMARVTLGHTGRSVRTPPAATVWACYAIGGVMLFRVIVPLIAPAHYVTWIATAQVFWMIAFSLFLYGYASFLYVSEYKSPECKRT